jgi:hypothetical protein
MKRALKIGIGIAAVGVAVGVLYFVGKKKGWFGSSGG